MQLLTSLEVFNPLFVSSFFHHYVNIYSNNIDCVSIALGDNSLTKLCSIIV